VVEVTLQNVNKLTVERQVLFDKPTNFELSKVDDSHYILNYLWSKPGILYLNSHPVFITPGDSIQLLHKVILKTSNVYRDTIIAKGNNSGNYTFSNFVDKRLPGGHFPELSDNRYKGDINLLYNDLKAYFSFRTRQYEALFAKGNYSKELVDFIKRKKRLDFLSVLVNFEGDILKQYPNQIANFSQKVESEFLNTVFIPSDTSYTRRMEEIFKNYLYRLVYFKGNGIKTEKDFSSTINRIQAYPNPFVREYLLCFLVIDYNEIWKKYENENSRSLVKHIKNPVISNEMKKYNL